MIKAVVRHCKAAFIHALCLILPCIVLSACSSKKFLGQNEYLLSDVKLVSTKANFETKKYRNYVRQEPNSKWFSWLKIPLGVYCLSKSDSVGRQRGLSKFFRKVGEAPVVYDKSLVAYSMYNLEHAMANDGFLRASVDTLVTYKGHKANVKYALNPGDRFHVNGIRYEFDSPQMRAAVLSDSAASLLYRGMPLNFNTLADERSRIISQLRNRGYYFINNDFVSYDIDTLSGEQGALVTLQFNQPANADSARAYEVQKFRKISIYEEVGGRDDIYSDSIHYRGLDFYYKDKPYMKKRVFVNHISLQPDSIYNDCQIQNIYGNLNNLPPVRYTSLRTYPIADSTDLLDCTISFQRNKSNSLKLDLEGTNTAGDLGAAVALSYSNRNTFRGAELFTFRIRTAYEAITGLAGYANQNYIEVSAEANMRFPILLFPFLSLESKRKQKAYSEVQFMYNTQNRPEFHRRLLTATWYYQWNKIGDTNWRHRLDLFSINYVYMPWISSTFRKDYLDSDTPYNSVLKASYENLLIMRTGYGFTYNNTTSGSQSARGASDISYDNSDYQVKFGIELAGNLLNCMSKLLNSKKNSNGAYEFVGITYSQYVKFDLDFTKKWSLMDNKSLVYHAAIGIGIPYGNSTVLPYEKRYFSGGANSVRGWSVRELGPGAYRGKDGKIDFINQTGNLKLDMNLELRTFLFWKFHSALFIDAGNIWNTRNYPNMDGALFKWNEFFRQIAVSYGAGLRLNFNYFILRFDGGMKAINPMVSHGKLHYPVIRPNFKRDFTLHFAVGLPF